MSRIKDVAALAGVSTSSVSRYFNNPELLKQETAEKISDAVNSLNYKPNALASSMRTRKTNSIALIIPSLTNLYYIDLHSYIHKACKNKGYFVNLYTTEYNQQTLLDYIEEIPYRQYDGVIICYLDEKDIENDLMKLQQEIPLVLITSDPEKTHFTSIFVDAMDGINKATKHLIDLGKKRIAFVEGRSINSIIGKEKYRGYTSAMEQAKLAINDTYVFWGIRNHFRTGFMAARYFLTQNPLPDGIVCTTDDVAMGCIKYLLHNGISIPDDIAVIGFNGISIMDSFEPTISTIAQPMEEIAESAIELLTEKIQYPRSIKKGKIFLSTLRIGTSTMKEAPISYSFRIE